MIKGENNKDVYLIFDYMETDLFNLCRLDEKHHLLTDVHRKYLIYQLLKAVSGRRGEEGGGREQGSFVI